MNYEKLFLIYCFEYYGESQAKLFDEISSPKLEYPIKFSENTEEENQKLLEKWKEQNDIKLSEFRIEKKPRFNKYGTPIYIRRIKGTYRQISFEVVE